MCSLLNRKWTIIFIALIVPIGLATKFYSGPGGEWILYYLGGILYVVFWSLVVFLIFPNVATWKICLLVFLATGGVEFLQLWHPDFLEAIRNNFLGRTLLGTTFVWRDFFYYFIGFLISFMLLELLLKIESLKRNK
ncbi:DUF2809 domain-containing protein [candidate division KSB1 bacterium]|nr:DUF2809 domain-containing protein [candidate division KSB1 bacterium]